MKRDVEFLFEIGGLRLQQRMWHRFFGSDVASISEHHYRVIWIALIIAAREQRGDISKIIKMALVHDIGESRTGDVDYISRQYVDRKEKSAIENILEGTSIQKEFKSFWNNYESRKSIEAKIVKDADNLDVDFELREQLFRGHRLVEEWKNSREDIRKKRFYTKAAQDIYDEISVVSPSDWHINSPYNRLNSGDWKV